MDGRIKVETDSMLRAATVPHCSATGQAIDRNFSEMGRVEMRNKYQWNANKEKNEQSGNAKQVSVERE